MFMFLYPPQNGGDCRLYDIQNKTIEWGQEKKKRQKGHRKSYHRREICPLIYPPDSTLRKKRGDEMDDYDEKTKEG